MKGKGARYKLSPNEEARLLKEETEKRRKLRLQQVREQSKQNSFKIRQAVKDEKNRQLQKLAADLQDQLEQEKNEKIRHLENQYENSLRSIGQGQKEASRQVDVAEERYLMQLEDNKRADSRFKSAIERERRERMFQEYEQKYHIIARQSALDVEKERAAKIASLPAPPPDPLLHLEKSRVKPVKMTDIDNFTTTHYHMREEYTVDKADKNDQENGKLAAEEEQLRIEEQDKARIRLINDRKTRAAVRHNAALEKELLSHDYGRILHDLSDLQRADREERQKVVANIPKQVFEPPHRRLQDREERQKDLEEAFEDMYMAETHYLGDISLALDPNPPADSSVVTEESQDISSHTNATPLREPTLASIPPVLRDSTNLPRDGEVSPKKPEKVLKKLMDKIKTQRQEWMSKSLQEPGDLHHDLHGDIDSETPEFKHTSHDDSRVPPLSEYSLSEKGSPDLQYSKDKPTQNGVPLQTHDTGKQPLLHPMEKAEKLRKEASVPKELPSDSKSIDQVLQTQKDIERQKRELEARLKQLEHTQKLLNQSARDHMSEQGFQTIPQATTARRPPLTHQPDRHQASLPNGYPAHLTNGFAVNSGPLQPQINGFHTDHPLHSVMNGHPSTMHYGTSIPQMSNGYRIPPTSHLHQQSHGFTVAEPGPHSQFRPIPPSVPGAQPGFPTPEDPFSSDSSSSQFKPPKLASSGPFSSTVPTEVPRTFITPSLPIPSTISMSIPTHSERTSDHLKKVREYQLSLLQKHEQSKKILAETRAEIEQRRQELIERFPQLELKSQDSDSSKSVTHDITVPNTQSVEVMKEPRLLTGSSLSPNKAAMSSLLSQLASQPYYSSRLSQPLQSEEGQQARLDQKTDKNADKKRDNVRKSLPFDNDDTIHATPDVSHRGRGLFGPSPGSTTDDFNDTVLSSSTEHGSPALPGGRSSGYTTGTESEQDKSLLNVAKERNDFFEKRQIELKKQLEEIQRQKEEILQRHQVGHLEIKASNSLPKPLVQEQPKQIVERPKPVQLQDYHADVDSSETDTSLDLSTSPVTSQQIKKPGQLLEQHQPHQLSTIQEVDSPSSTRHSARTLSGHPSLSSSQRSSLSRTSVEAPHPATIPEERDPSPTERRAVGDLVDTPPTQHRTVGDTGYQTSQLQEVMARAAELNPTLLENLRRQTNDVFYSLKEDDSVDSSHKHSLLSLSTGPITPDSLSTGPLEGRELSGATINSYNSPASEYSALKPMKTAGQISSDTSHLSGKSWAEELAVYNGSFHPPEERASLETEASFKPMKQSLDSDISQVEKSADRSYKVLHFTPREDTSRSLDMKSIEEKSPSLTDMRASELSQYSMSEDDSSRRNSDTNSPNVRASELSQYPISGEASPLSESSKQSASMQSNKDNDIMPSLASTMTESIQSCSSTYMDIKGDNGVLSTRDFDFIGRGNKFQMETDTRKSEISEKPDTTQNFSGALEFTSTPNAKEGGMKNNRLSQVSQYTISPEESKIQAGSNYMPQSHSGHFAHVKVGSDHSFGVVSTHPQAFTTVSAPNFLSRVSEESLDSGKSFESTSKNMIRMKEDSSLSQYTDPSSTEQLSLTQITLEPNSFVTKPDRTSLSQFTLNSSPDSSGKDNSSLSQYSMGSSYNKLSDTNNSNNQAASGLSNGEEEDDAFVEKKFANLDQLIRESKDLITKHKEMIGRNKAFDSSNSADLPPPLPMSSPPKDLERSADMEESTQNFGKDLDQKQEEDSMQFSRDPLSQLTDSNYMLDLDKLGQESGITDEPDLTLVSSTHDTSNLGDITNRSEDASAMLGEVTHRSDNASSASDSVLSFEQHEQSMRSTPDKELLENQDTRRDAGMHVERDAGEENVFRAVPAMVSPTLALSMKFDSSQQQFTKPPVSWSIEDEDTKAGSGLDLKSDAPPIVSKVIVPSKKTESNQKSAPSDKSGLNRALQPRNSMDSTNKKPETPASSSKSTKAMSLGDFLTSSKKESTSILGKRPTKQPPAVKPKPQRRAASSTDCYNATASGPSMVVPTPSELSKTLSSWKKSRGVRPGPAPPTHSRELPQTSTRMSQDSLSKSNEEKPYEHNMRLQSRIEEGKLTKDKDEEKPKTQASHREKVKEFQKKLQENMTRKQQMKKNKKPTK